MVSLCYAGRGVGQAIAEKYATEGFTLILTARSKDQLEEFRERGLPLATKQRAPPCDTFGVDLSKSDKVRKFAKDVLDKYKNVDILVNNAGMGPSSGSGPIKGISRLAHARSAEESAAYTATDSGADQQGPDLSPLSPLLQRQFHIFLPLATSSSQHTAADKCGGHVTSVLMATPMNGRQLCIADQMAMAALTVPVVRSVTTTPFHPRILLLLLSGVTRTSSAQATTP
ncbi:TPA: hypothetical protein ACH3X3_001337 [Trebouxia sp. C0006]